MSDQFNRQKITREIARIKKASEEAIKEVTEMRRIFNEAYARVVQERDSLKKRAEKAEKEIERLREIITECDGIECVKHDVLVRTAVKEQARLRQELADLKELTYERAPKIAAEEANKQIKPLKEEIERLRLELGYIANAKRRNIPVAEDFRDWAQSRARHALGQKPGELTVKKT
jgi:hypothetical protein